MYWEGKNVKVREKENICQAKQQKEKEEKSTVYQNGVNEEV